MLNRLSRMKAKVEKIKCDFGKFCKEVQGRTMLPSFEPNLMSNLELSVLPRLIQIHAVLGIDVVVKIVLR